MDGLSEGRPKRCDPFARGCLAYEPAHRATVAAEVGQVAAAIYVRQGSLVMRDVPIEDLDESEESRSAKLVAPRCARNLGSPDHRSVLQEETMTERHVAPRCARTHPMIGKPKRLDHLFGAYSAPIYFITAVTARRARVLATEPVHAALRAYALDNLQEGRAMGRYVIMPDHLHFFVFKFKF